MSSITELLSREWLPVVEAGQVLGLGRNAAYAAAKRGDFPTVRMGKKIIVPTAPLRGMLRITEVTMKAA